MLTTGSCQQNDDNAAKLADADIEAMADEAERGYDVEAPKMRCRVPDVASTAAKSSSPRMAGHVLMVALAPSTLDGAVIPWSHGQEPDGPAGRRARR